MRRGLGVSDKTVGAVRKGMEGTAEIPQLKKTEGKDGKTRPRKASSNTEKKNNNIQYCNPEKPHCTLRAPAISSSPTETPAIINMNLPRLSFIVKRLGRILCPSPPSPFIRNTSVPDNLSQVPSGGDPVW